MKYIIVFLIFTMYNLSTLQQKEKVKNINGTEQSPETIDQQIIILLNKLAEHDPNVLSKRVIFDFKKISLNDYFKISQPEKLIQSLPVTSKNIYEVTHLLNTVVSCEFSNITYYFIRLIDEGFESCRLYIVESYQRIQ